MNTRLFDIFDNHRFLKFNSPWWSSWEDIYNTPEPSYPPYDIEKDGDKTILTFAVAGFKKEDLSVTHIKRNKKLKVSGATEPIEKPCREVKKGIAKRPFNIEFVMNDAKVASTKLENGLLTIVVEPVDPPKDEVEEIEIK